MIFLLLSVLCSSLIIWIFKLYSKYEIHNLQAIIVNYGICLGCGLLISPSIESTDVHVWWPYTLSLGFLFIIGFNLIALATQKIGAAAVSVSSKASMIFPIIIALLYYNDVLTLNKWIAIPVALIAVVLTGIKKDHADFSKKKTIILIALVLVSSGIIEILINFNQRFHLSEQDFPLYLALSFGFAGLLGIVSTRFRSVPWNQKSIIAGVILGIPNFGSLFFLLKALESGIAPSIYFPINNIGIILLSSFGAILFLKEKLNTYNYLGLLLAVISIVILIYDSIM